jgi:hypothetical protein
MNAYEYVFPVAAGDFVEKSSENAMKIRQVLGTCFSIGEGFFLTAAHVISSALGYEWAGIGFPLEKIWQGSTLINSEILEDLDIGIIQAEIPHYKSLMWNTQTLAMWESARTVGFPYALDLEHFHLNVRAFAGHVVSEMNFYGLRAKPRIYELSFQAPRGLSGAPLLTQKGKMFVSGLVIGNKSTEMQIFSDREIVADGNKEILVERYEALQLGIAVSSTAILELHSKILGSTLRDHLAKNGLAG